MNTTRHPKKPSRWMKSLSVGLGVACAIWAVCPVRADDMADWAKAMGQKLEKRCQDKGFVSWDDSRLHAFWPRTSFVAGGLEKLVDRLPLVEADGQTLGFFLTHDDLPSSVEKNPYVRLTKDRGLDGKSPEERLKDQIMASPGTLSPPDVFAMAVSACNGDYALAMLTAHNFLKEVAYGTRDKKQAILAWNPENREDVLQQVMIQPPLIAKRLRGIRPPGDAHPEDPLGPWYHMFGLFFVSSVTGGKEAAISAGTENFLRQLKMGSKSDPFKESVNSWAAAEGGRFNQIVFVDCADERLPLTEVVETPPLPPSGPATQPLGTIIVNVFDADSSWEEIRTAKIELSTEVDGARFVYQGSVGAALDVVPGRYLIKASAPDYEPAEKRGVEVKKAEQVIVPIPLRTVLGTLVVTAKEAGSVDQLTGLPFRITMIGGGATSSPMNFGSPYALPIEPGDYKIEAARVHNGIEYFEESQTAHVTSRQTSTVTLTMRRVPPAPVPTQVIISPASFDFNIGDGGQVGATVLDQNGQVIKDATVVWSASAPSVAVVSANGMVHAAGRGQGRILATCGKVSGSIPVTVRDTSLLQECRILNCPARLPARGGSAMPKIEAKDTDGRIMKDVAVSWASSNYVVALINESTGEVTTEEPGKVTFFATVTATDGTEALCAIDVEVVREYATVLCSGKVTYSDASAAAGAIVQVNGGAAVTAASDGSFTAQAGGGPHKETATLPATATRGGLSGSASGRVVDGYVDTIVIVLDKGNSAAQPGSDDEDDLFGLSGPGGSEDLGSPGADPDYQNPLDPTAPSADEGLGDDQPGDLLGDGADVPEEEGGISETPDSSEEAPTFQSAGGVLTGEATIDLPPVQVSGDAVVLRQSGGITIRITIDVANGRFETTLSGGTDALVGHLSDDPETIPVSSSVTGNFSGTFNGTDQSGNLDGSGSLTESGMGSSSSRGGTFSGILSDGWVSCAVHCGPECEGLVFRVAVER